jgi:hypothetical protein
LKVLFDEDVPHPLRPVLPNHDIRTVPGMGWAGVKNGELLKRIGAEYFDVFLTGDKNLPKQQNRSSRPFAVLVLSAINWTVIRKNGASFPKRSMPPALGPSVRSTAARSCRSVGGDRLRRRSETLFVNFNELECRSSTATAHKSSASAAQCTSSRL